MSTKFIASSSWSLGIGRQRRVLMPACVNQYDVNVTTTFFGGGWWVIVSGPPPPLPTYGLGISFACNSKLNCALTYSVLGMYLYCDECGNINTQHNVVTRELWLSFKRISAFLSFRETIFRVPWGRNALVTPSNTQHNQLLISSGNLLYHIAFHVALLPTKT